MFTHYSFNTLAVNPGYAGSRDALTVTGLHRSQWVDYKGAPITQTLTMHTPFKNQHIGLGLSFVNDKIGPINTTSTYVDFAYILKLNEKSKLAFGLKGGINIMQAKLNTLILDEQNDVVFQDNINNQITPNAGFGLYYYRERFYAGVSTPKLFENTYKVNQSSGTTSLAKEKRHYFFIAGTVLNLAENVQFKPTTYIKVTPAAPIEADLTASFILHKKLLLGVMFRTGDAVGALIGIDATDQFHIGYSFDWSYAVKTGKYNYGSHEILLRYDFIFFDKKRIRSPRYF
jgi:type IX secretion system PorP/SprF family membrane protein